MLTDLLLFLIPLSLTALVSTPIFWFAPFLVYLFYKKPLTDCLMWTLSAGIFLDLMSPGTRFGLFSLIMLIATWVLYGRKQRFFFDSLSTFPIMSALYSALVYLMLGIATQVPLSTSWMLSDLILMPLLDAFVAFIGITLPLWILGPKRRKGEEYFL